VIAAMNTYFSIDKWNFGDTFYFSELAAYLHSNLGSIISSVVLVPLDRQKFFGDLYEIRCTPTEIFANGATINDVEVIEALTSNNLRTASGSGVTFAAGGSSTSTSSSSTSSSTSSSSSSSGGGSYGGGGSY
jgi:hypothetical protein